MKTFIIIVSAIALTTTVATVVLAADLIKLSQEVRNLSSTTDRLEDYTRAQFYKKDAQLYLMNSQYGNANVHRMLADSLKTDCLIYKINKK